MYGSSLRMETCRPRALRSRPMLAAVMPLPSEEVTPPVTKTYFAIGRASGGFSNATGKPGPCHGHVRTKLRELVHHGQDEPRPGSPSGLRPRGTARDPPSGPR